jgi:hypothetical protein
MSYHIFFILDERNTYPRQSSIRLDDEWVVEPIVVKELLD